MHQQVRTVLLSQNALQFEKKALEFATTKHAAQTRANGDPYVTHPIRVMNTIKSLSNDLDLICAAVLHDTLEDTSTTYEEIQTEFSNRTASLVKEVTSDKNFIKSLGESEFAAHTANKTHATQDLIKRYHEKLPNLDQHYLKKALGKSLYLSNKINNMSIEALLIKLSDRLDNVTDLSGCTENEKVSYAVHTEFLLDNLKRNDLTDTHNQLFQRIRTAITPYVNWRE